MSFLRPHRSWISLLILSSAIIGGSDPALDYMRGKASHNLAETQAARIKAEHELAQLRTDVATARKLSSQIGRDEVAQILAPVDRLKTVEEFEYESHIAKIIHFTYTLAPEERVALSAGGEAQDMAISTVALSGDASDDPAIYAFIENVRRHLAGRAYLQQLTVQRSEAPGAPSIHFEATYQWLSNGALQTVASGQ